MTFSKKYSGLGRKKCKKSRIQFCKLISLKAILILDKSVVIAYSIYILAEGIKTSYFY